MTVLPILLLSVGMAVFSVLSWQSTVREARGELRAMARAVAASVSQITYSLESTLLIAGARLVEAGALDDPEASREIIDRLLASNSSLVAFGLSRPDGQLTLVSGIPSGASLPNLRDNDLTRPGFDAAVAAQGRIVVGKTYFMSAFDTWILPIRAAVVDSSDAVVAVMTAGVRVDDIKSRWALDASDDLDFSLMTFDGHWQVAPEGTDMSTAPTIGSGLAELAVARLREGTSPHPGLIPDGSALMTGLLLEDMDMVLWAESKRGVIVERFLGQFRLGLAMLLVGALAIVGLLFGGRKLMNRYEAVLLRQANVDELTGLPNRAVIVDRVQQLVEVSHRQDWHFAYLLMDIDHFKRINDVRGHAFGDRVLARLAKRLRGRLPAEVTVARIGGDEFSLLFAARDLNALRRRLTQVLELVREPLEMPGGALHITASIGVASCPEDGSEPGELHRKADTALHQAKAYGRNRWTLFSSDLDVRLGREIQVIDQLRETLRDDKLKVAYQPIVHAGSGAIDSVEALARWDDETLGSVSPCEFIAVAEDAHLIDHLTERVIEHCARDLDGLMGTGGSPLGVAINISAVQLADPDFARWFGQSCARAGLKLPRVTVELTESALIDAADEATLQIRMLRAAGCRVFLDDFGTGYSSIAYLRRMPLDAIKIDRQFVATLDQPGSIDHGLVRGILSMAEPMGLRVVAEGIERRSQADVLRAMGADWLQGNYFSPAVDIAELRTVLANAINTAES